MNGSSRVHACDAPAEKPPYEFAEFVDYGKASKMIETVFVTGVPTSDGAATPDNYVS